MFFPWLPIAMTGRLQTTSVMCSNPRPCRYGPKCMFAHSLEESRVFRAVKEAREAARRQVGGRGGIAMCLGQANEQLVGRQLAGAPLEASLLAGAARSCRTARPLAAPPPQPGPAASHRLAPAPRTLLGCLQEGEASKGSFQDGQEESEPQQQWREPQQQPYCHPQKYKTTLCIHWERRGDCRCGGQAWGRQWGRQWGR